MADDVVFVVVGRKPFGKKEFAAGALALKNVRMEAESDVEEVTVVADWAWSRTHLTVTMTPPNGNPIRRSGYTLTIWRKKPDGRWVIARDANLLTAE